MRQLFHIVIILLVLISFGLAKLGFERRLSAAMVEDKLIQPALKEGTSLKLGQTSAIVALGGLRSLVASIWNLRAFHHFENIDWIQLEESYKIITTLQPQTTHYWKTGAWHLHTNASVFYNENDELSPIRRSAMRKRYIQKGSSFLEEAVLQNPDNWQLHLELAKLWSDSFKKPNLSRAVAHYKDTLACESLPNYQRAKLERFTFYTMTRSSEHATEAYEYGKRLFNEPNQIRTPNLSTCLFALQNYLKIKEAERIPSSELFPSKQTQLQWLRNYRDHRHQEYPMNGVIVAIKSLEALDTDTN